MNQKQRCVGETGSFPTCRKLETMTKLVIDIDQTNTISHVAWYHEDIFKKNHFVLTVLMQITTSFHKKKMFIHTITTSVKHKILEKARYVQEQQLCLAIRHLRILRNIDTTFRKSTERFGLYFYLYDTSDLASRFDRTWLLI